MKRHSIVRLFSTNILADDDIALFTGRSMCAEAYKYDREGNFYLNDNFGLAISVAIGIAMLSVNRVFVFTGEGDLIRELGAGLHAGISKCKNLYIVILNNKIYDSAGPAPNIFGAMNSTRSMLSSFGLFVHDYTPYFEDKNYKAINEFFGNIKGPLAIFVDIEPGAQKKINAVDLNSKELSIRLHNFIKKTSASMEQLSKENEVPILELNEQVKFGGNN